MENRLQQRAAYNFTFNNLTRNNLTFNQANLENDYARKSTKEFVRRLYQTITERLEARMTKINLYSEVKSGGKYFLSSNCEIKCFSCRSKFDETNREDIFKVDFSAECASCHFKPNFVNRILVNIENMDEKFLLFDICEPAESNTHPSATEERFQRPFYPVDSNENSENSRKF